MKCRRFLAILPQAALFLALLAIVASPPMLAQEAATEEVTATGEQVKKLIQQLGANDYTARERAQQELAKIGLFAFDELQEAQQSDTIEIAIRARKLVRGMHVQWHMEGDAPEVAQVLKSYSDQTEPDRRSSIDRLSRIGNRAGIPALARLTRYEPSHELSKYAALLIMQQPIAEDPAAKADIAKVLQQVVQNSRRSGAEWLRVYSKTLLEPKKHFEDWKKIAQDEQETLRNQPQLTSREIVRDLLRFQALLLKREGQAEDALEMMRSVAKLTLNDPIDLAESLGWLVENDAHTIVDELVAKSRTMVDEDPSLLYLLAESQLRRGDMAAADATAAAAVALMPQDHRLHYQTAELLQHRGHFQWSEAEFRVAITSRNPPTAVVSMIKLAEMLHDISADVRAGEVLSALIERSNTDEGTRNYLEERGDVGARHSRMHYFLACDAYKQNNPAKAKQHLQDAITHDPTDADVLIALYRLPDATEAEMRDTKALIENTTVKFAEDVKEATMLLDRNDPASLENMDGTQKFFIGQACNQYAWLVANTFGDQDEALRCGLLSVEVGPDDSGRIDTLARCYFAKGDIDAAIRTQQSAIKLDPYSGALARQLKFFETEKEKQAAEGKPAKT